ncbi:MAG: phospholipase [Candidatus Cryptobacteroides sp.]
MKHFIAIALALSLSAFSLVHGREYVDRIYHSELGQDIPYKVAFPENFDPAKSYPLLLFLHGSGERGTDNSLQIHHGGDLFLNDPGLQDVIVIAPQCPKEDYWVNIVPVSDNSKRMFSENAPISVSLYGVKALLDAFISLGFVDTEHIYGCGLSMGAFGILDLTVRYPDFFTAVEPICGGINSERLKAWEGRTAFRFFHGHKDDVVLPSFSIEANSILQDKGVESSIVLYPEANHNSWTPAFAEPDFISWLLKH